MVRERRLVYSRQRLWGDANPDFLLQECGKPVIDAIYKRGFGLFHMSSDSWYKYSTGKSLPKDAACPAAASV